MTTTIKKLSKLNVAAINETMLTGVTTTATTATFDGTPADAIKLVEQTMNQLGGGNAHPRGSLHAVLRRLHAVETEAAPVVDTTPEPVADEFPTMAITPEEFADALLADMLNLDTPEETTVTTAETVTLPEGIAETPALRPVYAALINGATTTREMVDATGIILAKVRVALNTLKAAGIAVASDQIQPGKPVTWSLTTATDEAQADKPEAGWNSTISPGGDDDTQPADSDADDTDDDEADDTPAATVDAPQAPRTAPKRVRLLAAYPNDPAPSTGGGKGRQMGPILEFLKANPGVEYTVREVQNALSLPDYPSAAHERLAADPSTGVSRVNHGNRKKFVYNPAAQ